jgi:hypothetical protein
LLVKLAGNFLLRSDFLHSLKLGRGREESDDGFRMEFVHLLKIAATSPFSTGFAAFLDPPVGRCAKVVGT